MKFNISELKKHLGPGLGLRKNKYMIEIPVPTVDGAFLNIMCQSAGLPERTINTTELWHKGRKYVVRGETDYGGGEYEISIVDDSEMKIRQVFDNWMKTIDNSKPDKNSSLLGASFEAIKPGLMNEIEAGVKTANQIKNAIQNPRQIADFFIGFLDPSKGMAAANYQMDINIWQLDGRQKQVYGYKLQNAFPKSVGIVTLDDSEENTLSQFSVTFAYSEFMPIYGLKEDILRGVVGDQTMDVVGGVKQLVSF